MSRASRPAVIDAPQNNPPAEGALKVRSILRRGRPTELKLSCQGPDSGMGLSDRARFWTPLTAKCDSDTMLCPKWKIRSAPCCISVYNVGIVALESVVARVSGLKLVDMRSAVLKGERSAVSIEACSCYDRHATLLACWQQVDHFHATVRMAQDIGKAENLDEGVKAVKYDAM